MRPNINHLGMFTGQGLSYILADELKVGIHSQASFPHYDKLAARGDNPDEVVLCQPNRIALGVFHDVAPDGKTAGIEINGFVWVCADLTGVSYGSLVTPGIDGIVVAATKPIPTSEEFLACVWQVDKVDTINSKVLIMINCIL